MTENTALVRHELPDIKDLLAGRLAPSSIAIYRQDVGQYQDFCLDQQLQQFDPQSFVLWRDWMVLHSMKSPHTINRQLAAVRRVTKEAASRRMITGEVAYGFANVESVSVRALRARLKPHAKTRITPTQMRALCDSPNPATLLGLRDRAMLHTLASSGVRLSELISLTVEQIEQQGDFYTMRIIGKTDIEARAAPLSVEAKHHIDAWIEHRMVASAYVFTSLTGRGDNRLTAEPLSDVGAWRIIIDYAETCGLQHVKPHDFRRFVATELSAKDVIMAQRALGHKSLATTERYVLSGLKPGLTDNLY